MIRLPGLRAPLNREHFRKAAVRFASVMSQKTGSAPPRENAHAQLPYVVPTPGILRREEKVRFGLSKTMRIVEIGPSYNPMVPKREGWNTVVIDHASRDDLVKKYEGHAGVNVDLIEEVDLVWNGGDIDALFVGDQLGAFDACVSSHVIEHFPDFIGFFQSASKLLTPRGLVSMAVPDKRFCFDWFRPHSTTGQILEANRNKTGRHRAAAQFDHTAYACKNDGAIAWGQAPIGELSLVSQDVSLAYALFSTEPSQQYVDCHGWQFTPASFELIVVELGAMGLIQFEIERMFPTEGCEFIVQLRKVTDVAKGDVSERRLALLRKIIEELGVQAAYMRAATS